MIIVTGASRGLGQAITERLIERGEEVIGLARNTSGLKINAIDKGLCSSEQIPTMIVIPSGSNN